MTRISRGVIAFTCAVLAGASGNRPVFAQGIGNSGTITGTVTDPSGAAIKGAAIQIQNKVTGYDRTTTADDTGTFKFLGVPQNTYHAVASAAGFQTHVEDVDVRTSVPVSLVISLALGSAATSLEVHADSDLIESVATAHVDVDASQFEKLPNSAVASGLNAVIAHSAPGIIEDSNGFIHPQGDHGQTQFVFDNQPITDQQSKQFSTSMPENAIASVEVITGAPPAEYGEKTSLVINAITKSGLGVDKTFGSVATTYGSFGTAAGSTTFGTGGKRWGEFVSANVVRSSRYLDPPEFSSLHNAGNNQTLFNRLDFQPNEGDTFHLNLFLARAWFQTPNTYDEQAAGQDQRERILSYNIAPSWVRVLNANSTIAVNPYFRQDQVHYKPSRNPFADQPASLSQTRRLTNTGVKADYSWSNRLNNFKAGIQLQHTFLSERFALGITDPDFIEESEAPGLAPYDLTRGGRLFRFADHTDIKQYAFYAQDTLTVKGLNIQAGLRGDVYRGLVGGQALQPRLAVSYLLKQTGTVVRASYSRFFETPYNEGLLVSSATGIGGLSSNIFGNFGSSPLSPGTRRQYNVGIQQSLGRHALADVGYFWKYTKNAYDFDTLFNTPVAFPIEWRKSKIDGAAARIVLTEIKGVSAYSVLGHTRARFFGPENGGLIFNSPLNTAVFRIDHDQAFQQTTNVRYQMKKNGPWASFTWKYDSGQVVGSVPDLESAYALTANQQAAIGLYCGSVFATLSKPISRCAGSGGALLVVIPAAGTANDDTNPSRVASRHLFDMAVGDDNLFHTDRVRYRIELTAVNLANKVGLYNFLSTFSGTHFVSPRSVTAEFGIVW